MVLDPVPENTAVYTLSVTGNVLQNIIALLVAFCFLHSPKILFFNPELSHQCPM